MMPSDVCRAHQMYVRDWYDDKGRWQILCYKMCNHIQQLLKSNYRVMFSWTAQIPRQNFVASSRLVENQAKSVLAERLKTNTAGVVDLIVWGNINGNHFIDASKVNLLIHWFPILSVYCIINQSRLLNFILFKMLQISFSQRDSEQAVLGKHSENWGRCWISVLRL